MATEKLNFDTYDGGWTSGAITDVDEAVASADGLFIATTIKDDVADMGLDASVVEDADTVDTIDVVVRARTNGSGTDKLGVELLIGGVVQGSRQDSANLTASFVNYNFSDVAWDADRTAAEMDGMEIRLTAVQSGMPTTAGHEVDCGDVDVVFTPAAGDVTLTADPGSLTLSGAVANFKQAVEALPASLVLTGAVAAFTIGTTLDAQPGSLTLSGAAASLNTTLDAQPGSLLLSGANADFSTGLTLDAQPGSLLLTGAEADLIAEGGPVIRRRGGRFLLMADREPEAIQELIELVEPEIARKAAETRSLASKTGPETTIRPAVTIPARKSARVTRLLAETGITLEELLKIIEL